MRKTVIASIGLVLGIFVGCGGSVSSGGSSSSSSNGSSSSGAGGSGICQGSGSSTLPGVSIEFTSTDCTFTMAEAAAGIQIDHQLVVTNDVANVRPMPQESGCAEAGPSLMYVFEKLEGNGQKYCLCDLGPCMSPTVDPMTLVTGTYPSSFSWDGKNWGGPSDFGAEKGPAFPPGDYTLTVSAIGNWSDGGTEKEYAITGTFPVHIVP